MMIIGIYNIKGGVGKTATAVNLSFLSARDGRRTLLCDLDPQGSASFYFDVGPGKKSNPEKLIRGKIDLETLIRDTEYMNLSILPADFSYRNLDIFLYDVKKSKKKLAEIFKPLKDDFDVIFLDCPPGITLLSENIFHAVDFLLVPVIPTTLSLRTYIQILSFLKKKKLSLSKVVPFFSMVERRKKMHREGVAFFPKKAKRMCRNIIPYLSDIEKMGLYRKPVHVFRPTSTASDAYLCLWQELKSVFFK